MRHPYLLILTVAVLLACDNTTKEEVPILKTPSLSTIEISNISQNTAKGGGRDIKKGSSSIIENGLCWSTKENPTINDNFTQEAADTLDFVSQLTDLQANTTYFVRAYATNDVGTGYGNQIMFTTLEESVFGEMEDFDGNVYKTVLINDQVWMAENLRVTRFNDGTDILEVSDENTWSINDHPMHSFQFNNEVKDSLYGAYYSMSVVNIDFNSGRNVCPTGWHVPTDSEWFSLQQDLGGRFVAGGKLKEASENHWRSPNEGATNETGFTALPGGYRSTNGSYYFYGLRAYYWTQSTRELNDNTYHVSYAMEYLHPGLTGTSFRIQDANHGNSIRCIKD